MIKIFFFGDSICFGQGVSIHCGWVTRISAKTGELSTEKKQPILLTNASVNGNTTRLALERIPYDIQTHHPDIVIVQFGMNDCNYWKSDNGLPRVSLAAFRANLIEIIERCFHFGARRVFINTNHPSTRSERFEYAPVSYQESNRRYNQVIREISGIDGRVFLNDIENRFEKNMQEKQIPLSELLLEDGLHLSVKGHDIYFDAVYPEIECAIKEGFYA